VPRYREVMEWARTQFPPKEARCDIHRYIRKQYNIAYGTWSCPMCDKEWNRRVSGLWTERLNLDDDD
jgi:hypothetical protein